MYLDLTGRFPHKSLRGFEYLYALYNFDSNAIKTLPIKNRQAKTLVDAWETLHKRISQYGHPTKHFVLDNKISAEFKAALKNTINIQVHTAKHTSTKYSREGNLHI